MKEADSGLKQNLLAETSKIPWRELQVFFAQGRTVHISAQLDLIDVAIAMSRDDAAQVEQWMRSGQLAQVSDDQARQWYEHDILVWSVVVKPWVLVQNIRDAVN